VPVDDKPAVITLGMVLRTNISWKEADGVLKSVAKLVSRTNCDLGVPVHIKGRGGTKNQTAPNQRVTCAHRGRYFPWMFSDLVPGDPIPDSLVVKSAHLKQGSTNWFRVRNGRATGSIAGKLRANGRTIHATLARVLVLQPADLSTASGVAAAVGRYASRGVEETAELSQL
jgi:hypothetical protein